MNHYRLYSDIWKDISRKYHIRNTFIESKPSPGKVGPGKFQIPLSSRPVQTNPDRSEACGPMGCFGLLFHFSNFWPEGLGCFKDQALSSSFKDSQLNAQLLDHCESKWTIKSQHQANKTLKSNKTFKDSIPKPQKVSQKPSQLKAFTKTINLNDSC